MNNSILTTQERSKRLLIICIAFFLRKDSCSSFFILVDSLASRYLEGTKSKNKINYVVSVKLKLVKNTSLNKSCLQISYLSL